MQSEKLLAALTACTDRLNNPKGIYVLHHAVNFAEALSVNVVGCPDAGAIVAGLVGMDIKLTKPEPFAAGARKPTALSVRLHIKWMLEHVPGTGGFNKKCRWLGFAAGAAARAGLCGHYYRKDLVDATDLPAMLQLAGMSGSVRHYLVHVVLGYLQGWLWADGQGSVNDFDRMNGADDEAPAVRTT